MYTEEYHVVTIDQKQFDIELHRQWHACGKHDVTVFNRTADGQEEFWMIDLTQDYFRVFHTVVVGALQIRFNDWARVVSVHCFH